MSQHETKHTPGPWTLRIDTPHYWVIGPDGFPVARIDWERENGNGNAALVLAAPDLLDALRLLCDRPHGSGLPLGMHDRGPHYDAMHEAWNIARAAIAKATGQAEGGTK